jgi:hypothetical protein
VKRNTLSKSERLCSERRIDALFSGGRRGGSGPLKFCWVATNGAAGGEAEGREATGKEATGKEAVSDRMVSNAAAVEGEIPGGEAVSSRMISSEAAAGASREAAGKEATGKESTGKEATGGAAGREAVVTVLFYVPKKAFKKAWKRNLIKRRMRESYRLRKHELIEKTAVAGRHIDIALICAPSPKGAANAAGAGSGVARVANAAGARAGAGANAARAGAKKSAGAKKNASKEAVIPDFKTIDNAIAKILEQVLARS